MATIRSRNGKWQAQVRRNGQRGLEASFWQSSLQAVSKCWLRVRISEWATDVVTLELGRQTDLQVTDQLRRRMQAECFTRLDRMLMAERRANREFADLRVDKDMLETMKRNPALLIGQAQYLEKLGLAGQIKPGMRQLDDRQKLHSARWGAG